MRIVLDWRQHYTPFGEELTSPAANDNQAGFTGHIKDKATGLNYMQARYYDPNIGRFLSVDPVSFMDSGNKPSYFNRYAYSGNDTVNRIDPTGEEWVYAQTTGKLEKHDAPVGIQPLDGALAGNSGNLPPIETPGLSDMGKNRQAAGWTVVKKTTGYSGALPNGQNNPATQNIPNVGPIPRGEWDIGATNNSPNTGPATITVTPKQNTTDFGRTDFRIHGDSRQNPGNASEGCIIVGRGIRNEITNSSDRDLRVVQ